MHDEILAAYDSIFETKPAHCESRWKTEATSIVGRCRDVGAMDAALFAVKHAVHAIAKGMWMPAGSFIYGDTSGVVMVERIKTLMALFELDDVVAHMDSLMAGMTRFMELNGLPASEFAPYDFALMLLTLESAIARFRVEVFRSGQPGAVIRLNSSIHRFSSKTEMVRATACQKEDGATVCILNNYYFYIAIRSGGVIALFADDKHGGYPNDRRIHFMFPYELLERKPALDDGDSVEGDVDGESVASLSDIDPKASAWIVGIVSRLHNSLPELIADKPDLYTGAVLLEAVDPEERANGLAIYHGANIALPKALPRLTWRDLLSDNVAGLYEPTEHPNQWIEDEFAHRIPDELLNLTGENRWFRYSDGDEGQVCSYFNISASGFDIEATGTREEIERRFLLNARHNMVRAMVDLADNVLRLNDEMLAYRIAAEGRLDILLEAIYRMEFYEDVVESKLVIGNGCSDVVPSPVRLNMVTVNESTNLDDYSNGFYLLGQYRGVEHYFKPRRASRIQCAVTGKGSVLSAKIIPHTVDGMSMISGISANEFSPCVQAFGRFKPENRGIHNYDPLATAEQPHKGTYLGVNIPLSKTAFNEGRKNLGLDRIDLEVKRKRC